MARIVLVDSDIPPSASNPKPDLYCRRQNRLTRESINLCWDKRLLEMVGRFFRSSGIRRSRLHSGGCVRSGSRQPTHFSTMQMVVVVVVVHYFCCCCCCRCWFRRSVLRPTELHAIVERHCRVCTNKDQNNNSTTSLWVRDDCAIIHSRALRAIVSISLHISFRLHNVRYHSSRGDWPLLLQWPPFRGSRRFPPFSIAAMKDGRFGSRIDFIDHLCTNHRR